MKRDYRNISQLSTGLVQERGDDVLSQDNANRDNEKKIDSGHICGEIQENLVSIG